MADIAKINNALLKFETEILYELNGVRECLSRFNKKHEHTRSEMSREHDEAGEPLANGVMYDIFPKHEQDRLAVDEITPEAPSPMAVLKEVLNDLQIEEKISRDLSAVIMKRIPGKNP